MENSLSLADWLFTDFIYFFCYFCGTTSAMAMAMATAALARGGNWSDVYECHPSSTQGHLHTHAHSHAHTNRHTHTLTLTEGDKRRDMRGAFGCLTDARYTDFFLYTAIHTHAHTQTHTHAHSLTLKHTHTHMHSQLKSHGAYAALSPVAFLRLCGYVCLSECACVRVCSCVCVGEPVCLCVWETI